MNVETLRHFLLWCTVINYAFLLLWVALSLQGHGWMHRLYGRLFHLSAEQFDAINFAGIILYKLGIVLFNLAPLISLYPSKSQKIALQHDYRQAGHPSLARKPGYAGPGIHGLDGPTRTASRRAVRRERAENSGNR